MNKFTMILVFGLVSCLDTEVSNSTGGAGNPATQAEAASAVSGESEVPGSHWGDVCGASDVDTVEFDGGAFTVEVPVACDPNYMYTGDPPPDEVEDRTGENPTERKTSPAVQPVSK